MGASQETQGTVLETKQGQSQGGVKCLEGDGWGGQVVGGSDLLVPQGLGWLGKGATQIL